MILRAETVSRRIGDLAIVDGVSVTLAAGEWTSLVGPSGCGKTTLLMMLGLLDRPDSGHIALAGEDTSAWTRAACARARLGKIGFVFQSGNLLDHLTTRDNVALPMWRATSSLGRARAAAAELLERFGLAARADALAGTLSAGEAARAAIARALINQPVVVLADEPTGNLDSANSAIVLDALGEVTARGAALLVATHDASVAARGRCVTMRDGRLAS